MIDEAIETTCFGKTSIKSTSFGEKISEEPRYLATTSF
jgi:hypothetical protein